MSKKKRKKGFGSLETEQTVPPAAPRALPRAAKRKLSPEFAVHRFTEADVGATSIEVEGVGVVGLPWPVSEDDVGKTVHYNTSRGRYMI